MPQLASPHVPRVAAHAWHAMQQQQQQLQQLLPSLCSSQLAAMAQGARADVPGVAPGLQDCVSPAALSTLIQPQQLLPPPSLSQAAWPVPFMGDPSHQHPPHLMHAPLAAAAQGAGLLRKYCTAASTPKTSTTAAPLAAAAAPPSRAAAFGGRGPEPGSAAALDAVWSLPNMLSIARGLSGPGIAYLILQEQWPWALGALTVSGLSDWADGALARRMGSSSVLGSYLDPLGDKALVGCVVAALSAQGALPPWVATLIIGRDVALVGGMFVVRWRSLGWRTPWSAPPLTRAEFFRTADAAPPLGRARDAGADSNGATASSAVLQQQLLQGAAPADAGVPFMRPLLISKVNTVLQLSLVGGCVTKAWLAWPQPELLDALEASTAAATALSMSAYAWQAAKGRLLAPK